MANLRDTAETLFAGIIQVRSKPRWASFMADRQYE
jgi:hypothetical protein